MKRIQITMTVGSSTSVLTSALLYQLFRRSLDAGQMADTIVPTQALRQEVLSAVQHEVIYMYIL